MVFQQNPLEKAYFICSTDWSDRPVLTNGKHPKSAEFTIAMAFKGNVCVR